MLTIKSRLSLLLFLFVFLSSISAFAGGAAKAVNGTVLVKKDQQDWHILQEGESLEPGLVLWFGPSSSAVVNVDDNLFELSGDGDGQDIKIVSFSSSEVKLSGGRVKDITPPRPPAAPVLLLPADGFKVREGKVALEWSNTRREVLYRIQTSSTPGFTKILTEEKSYATDKKIEGLSTPGKIYWRVSAISKEGLESPFSEPRSFEVKPLPEPPSLNLPAATKTSTTFRWKRKGEDEKYRLQISRNKEFSEIAIDLKNIEGPRVTVGSMEAGDYFVRVSAADVEGFEGRFSDPVPFYVGPKVSSPNIGPIMIMVGVAAMLLGIH